MTLANKTRPKRLRHLLCEGVIVQPNWRGRRPSFHSYHICCKIINKLTPLQLHVPQWPPHQGGFQPTKSHPPSYANKNAGRKGLFYLEPELYQIFSWKRMHLPPILTKKPFLPKKKSVGGQCLSLFFLPLYIPRFLIQGKQPLQFIQTTTAPLTWGGAIWGCIVIGGGFSVQIRTRFISTVTNRSCVSSFSV